MCSTNLIFWPHPHCLQHHCHHSLIVLPSLPHLSIVTTHALTHLPSPWPMTPLLNLDKDLDKDCFFAWPLLPAHCLTPYQHPWLLPLTMPMPKYASPCQQTRPLIIFDKSWCLCWPELCWPCPECLSCHQHRKSLCNCLAHWKCMEGPCQPWPFTK